MTDEELLTLAAKAAGYTLWWKEGTCKGGPYRAPFIGDRPWRPLEDDGDAFRLAVKLGMNTVFGANYVIVNGDVQMPTVNNANDPYAATRRAIVRAAAELEENNL